MLRRNAPMNPEARAARHGVVRRLEEDERRLLRGAFEATRASAPDGVSSIHWVNLYLNHAFTMEHPWREELHAWVMRNVARMLLSTWPEVHVLAYGFITNPARNPQGQPFQLRLHEDLEHAVHPPDPGDRRERHRSSSGGRTRRRHLGSPSRRRLASRRLAGRGAGRAARRAHAGRSLGRPPLDQRAVDRDRRDRPGDGRPRRPRDTDSTPESRFDPGVDPSISGRSAGRPGWRCTRTPTAAGATRRRAARTSRRPRSPGARSTSSHRDAGDRDRGRQAPRRG